MAKHTISETVAAEFWKRLTENTPILHGVNLMISGPGPRVPRGSTKKAETEKAMIELIRMVHDYALQQGYDMGASVFGGDE